MRRVLEDGEMAFLKGKQLPVAKQHTIKDLKGSGSKEIQLTHSAEPNLILDNLHGLSKSGWA
jgi:hypothetical protein